MHFTPTPSGAMGPLPKVSGRGRKKGIGPLVSALKAMVPGQEGWHITKNRINSIRSICKRHGLSITTRRIPHTDLYMFIYHGPKQS